MIVRAQLAVLNFRTRVGLAQSRNKKGGLREIYTQILEDRIALGC